MLITYDSGGIAYKTVQLDAELQGDLSMVTVSTVIGRHQIERLDKRLPSARYVVSWRS